MIKVEYYENDKFLITYKIAPAFMQDGFRILRKREYERETTVGFNGKVFANELEALNAITNVLDKHIFIGLLKEYKIVKE